MTNQEIEYIIEKREENKKMAEANLKLMIAGVVFGVGGIICTTALDGVAFPNLTSAYILTSAVNLAKFLGFGGAGVHFISSTIKYGRSSELNNLLNEFKEEQPEQNQDIEKEGQPEQNQDIEKEGKSR